MYFSLLYVHPTTETTETTETTDQHFCKDKRRGSWGQVEQLIIASVCPVITMAGKADAYSDIDFEEINEATGLAPDEIKCLKVRLIP